MSFLYTRERHERERKRGSYSLLAGIIYLLPWYVAKGIIIFIAAFFIIFPIVDYL